MTIKLVGIDPVYQREIQNENYLNQPVKVYLVSVNEGVVTSDEIIHSGYLDQPVFTKDPDKGMLTITCKTVNEFKRLDQTNGTRTANSVQQFWFPNDKGMEYAGKKRYVGKWK
ncbi:hypothetical protein C942_00507 [Photobacterium marinum]|uniref:Uncharacterized protein n=2 Tax=Photobacterium marinum TaxID=1056511 RepID=L8JB27_9GAMM|nr:hypothetical protein C942_00507 [Photobacterium marinum]